MIHIPTWVDNLLLLVSFVAVSLQYRFIDPPRRIMNVRFWVMVVCAVLMVLAAIFNRPGTWLSLVLFVAALLCVAVTIQLQRSMPPKPAQH
jgi:small-conductance mechanosensitive channel